MNEQWLMLAAPVLGVVVGGLLRRAHGGGPGLWDVLLVLANGRTQSRRERERRLTVFGVLDRIEPGSMVEEVDGVGQPRTLVYRFGSEDGV